MATYTAPLEPIPAELLRSELTGVVDDGDYFARSRNYLERLEIDPTTLEQYHTDDSISFEDINLMSQPGDLAMEEGIVRRSDGTLYIAVRTDLGTEVTGDMIDWWFCNCDSTEKYKWWHPKDHISAVWDPPYYGAMSFERMKGHYVDHVHVVEENIAGMKQSLQIEFTRPSKYFDVTKFLEQGITCMMVARIHVNDESLGLVAAGHLLHMVRVVEGGRSELRSRFWLGDISYPETPENFFFASSVNWLARQYLTRLIKLPFSTGQSLYKHCKEEMACLREFLPHYYYTARKEQAEFMEKFNFGKA
jgi:hypothetical protein